MRLPQGPFQQLQKAQAQLQAAIQRGTSAQLQDAVLKLQRATQAVQKATQGPLLPQGPFQRLAKAQADFQRALTTGTAAQIKDAELNLKQAKAAADRAGRGPASLGQRLMTALSTSRIGFGGGSGPNLMPLANKLGAVIGGDEHGAEVGAALGAYAAALSLAIKGLTITFHLAQAGIRAFVQVLQQAAEQGRALNAARLQSGGNAGNVSFLSALGLSPESIPGLAGSLRDRLSVGSGNPFAMIAGQRLGAGAVLPKNIAPGMDEAGLLQTVVKGLAGIQDASARFRAAVQLDATSLLPSVEFYQRHRAAVDADAGSLAKIADTGFQQASADLTGSLDRLRANFLQVVMAFAKPFMKPVADFLSRLADRLRDLATWVNNNQDAVAKLRDALTQLAVGFLEVGKAVGLLMLNFGKLLMALYGNRGPGAQLGYSIGMAGALLFKGADLLSKTILGGGDGLQAGLDANTKALMGNTAALQSGTFGGGERTRRAVGQRLPGYLEAIQFDRAVAGQAYRLGAF